jgi:hypothetical protein
MIIDFERLGAFSVHDFCATYGIGRSKAYELLNDGAFQARKVGKLTLIDKASVARWFNALPPYEPQSALPTGRQAINSTSNAFSEPSGKAAKRASKARPWSSPRNTPDAPPR